MLDLIFPLNIFPPGSLSSSVITTVWIGVFVVVFFNLRLGWVLSGLVVPGYLVPLLLIKPWAVVAILIEAIVAYYLIWFFSERLSRYGFWSALFGRDRFFALLLASIVVRVTFDGWLLPWVGAYAAEFGLVFDYRNELHSLGLVIVALVANQFWKTGVLRGLPPFLVILFTTWLIVKYVLMTLTNFGLGDIGYMYEDIAASILASPKAYIILLTTAFVASRMNLRYGWDFNGILIPALLALQWYEPLKILVSFGEAFIILGLAIWTLKLPVFANTTIEGGRKLLLFFNIAFIYKILLAYILLHTVPEIKISDYFAFGYMLSTLLAIKMHDKGIAIRMTRATIQTSLVSLFIASVLGYALTIMPNYQPWLATKNAVADTEIIDADITLLDRIKSIKPDIYRSRFSELHIPLTQEVDAFNEGTRLLLDYSRSSDQALLKRGMYQLNQLGYQTELIEDQYLLLKESVPRSWGYYVINLKAENELLIELPSPLEDRGLVEAVASLFVTLNARSLAISGTDASLLQSQTLFDGFHRLAGRRDVLQIHTYSKSITRAIKTAGIATQNDAIANNESPAASELWVKKQLPPSLDLVKMQNIVGKYKMHWGEINNDNAQREASREGYAELIINLSGLRKLLISPLLNARKTELFTGDRRIDGYLQEWLLGTKGQIAESGSNAYAVPAKEELLYLDEEVLTPLLATMKYGYLNGKWTKESLEELQVINGAANVLGYEIIRYQHSETSDNYVILSEFKQNNRRYWGTYVFRLGDAEPFVVQSPRPLFEVNSFEVAVSLFERSRANALLIGGAHPLTNRDYSADLVRLKNQLSLFTLVNQVTMREKGELPLLSVQCRALGQQFGQKLPDDDMLIAFDDGAIREESFTVLQQKLLDSLTADSWQYSFVNGSINTMGYQVGGSSQARYVHASTNKSFALLWVSPIVRSSYKQQRSNDALSLQFLSLGIPSIEADLYDYVNALAKNTSSSLKKDITTTLQKYQDTQDIVLLKKMAEYDNSIKRIIDKNTKQAFLLLHNNKNELAIIGNLNPLVASSTHQIPAHDFSRGKLDDYVETRIARLVFE